MDKRPTEYLIENAVSSYLKQLSRASEAMRALDNMDIFTPADLHEVMLPPSIRECDIQSIISKDENMIFPSLGEKIIAEAEFVEELDDGYKITLRSSVPKIILNTATETLTGVWDDHSYTRDLPASICESLVDALAAHSSKALSL